jgi:alpha-L-rhamnosidase
MAPIRISAVAFEHHTTGFGVGHGSPRISWSFSADDEKQSWSQKSYDIQVGRHDHEGRTYHVDGSESALVPWPEQPLSSRERVWVKIRANGQGSDTSGSVIGTATDWSEAAFVEAGLLDSRDWTAKLTASQFRQDNKKNLRPVRFRKCFSLAHDLGKISKARLYITAHGVYEASINGQKVGKEEMAPGWTSYTHRLAYQTFDVAEQLAPGKTNVFGVEVGAGWFAGRLGWKGKRCFYGDRLAFVAQLEVLFESGKRYTLNSDDTWKSHLSAALQSEIYDGEDYDSREEQPGWTTNPDFDDHSWTGTEQLNFSFESLVASDAPPVRETGVVSPVKIFKSKSGKTLVDFGQNLVGKLRVRLPTVAEGTNLEGHKVSFNHAEVLEHEELGTRPLRSAKPIDNVWLSQKQPSVWSPKFTFHGFRYVQIDGWPTPDGMPDHDDVTALVLHSDMQRTGWFSCSDPLVNKLHDNVLWSMRGNFLSLPTDCPQRDERLGWTGDIQVFGPSANFIFNTHGFLGGWLEDLSAEQLEEGKNGVPGLVVPDVIFPAVTGDPQCAWHDCTVLTPWDLYQSSGDVEILRRQYPSMKAWVDQGLPRGPNGLWDQNLWQLGDWLDPAAPPDEPGRAMTDGNLVADLYLVRVLDTISKVSVLLNEQADAERYSNEAASVKETFRREYITPAGLVVGDTQTAHALALCFEVFANKSQVRKSASRLCHLVHDNKYRIGTGFAGTPLITHALSDTGHHQLAYRMLLEQKCPSWLYPITMGATTIWERWDSMLPDGSINPGQMTSFNHYALGSVAHWLHKNVGGISPLTPGWQHFRVRPMPGGTVTSATVKYDSAYGRIECAWQIDDSSGKFDMTLVVPPNSKALVVLPSDWRGVEEDGEERSTTVGSGRHEFACLYEAAAWPPQAEFARSTFRKVV